MKVSVQFPSQSQVPLDPRSVEMKVAIGAEAEVQGLARDLSHTWCGQAGTSHITSFCLSFLPVHEAILVPILCAPYEAEMS